LNRFESTQRLESILHNDLKFEGEIWENRLLKAKAFVQVRVWFGVWYRGVVWCLI
jgi:hypothetical protein